MFVFKNTQFYRTINAVNVAVKLDNFFKYILIKYFFDSVVVVLIIFYYLDCPCHGNRRVAACLFDISEVHS